MRTGAPMKVLLYLPKTETGERMLARRVATVHANVVVASIKNLPCSTAQKQNLLKQAIQNNL